MDVILAIALVGMVISFVIISSTTLFLDRNYVITTGWLFIITLLAVILVITGLSSGMNGSHVFFTILGVIFLIPFGSLFSLKLVFRDNWFQPTHRAFRTLVKIDLPHEELPPLKTPDGVTIRGYHVHGPQLRDEVVIIAHGGFRSKDLFVKAMLAAWLSVNFDVIGFDFRGHGDSSGVFTGDGKSVADLKVVIDHAHQKGYQKVGVYGRSMGGWTAILEAAHYHDVDAIVIAGMPPGFYSEVPEFKGRIKLLKFFGASYLMKLLMGVRFKYFDDVKSAYHEIQNVSTDQKSIPLLILYNESDPSAGVDGIRGNWSTIPKQNREKSFRDLDKLPYQAEDVFNKASEPKRLSILPGVGHVYGLATTRKLFLEVESWFIEHLK